MKSPKSEEQPEFCIVCSGVYPQRFNRLSPALRLGTCCLLQLEVSLAKELLEGTTNLSSTSEVLERKAGPLLVAIDLYWMVLLDLLVSIEVILQASLPGDEEQKLQQDSAPCPHQANPAR